MQPDVVMKSATETIPKLPQITQYIWRRIFVKIFCDNPIVLHSFFLQSYLIKLSAHQFIGQIFSTVVFSGVWRVFRVVIVIGCT